MEGLKFITYSDLCLQEQFNIKFEKQGDYTLDTLRDVQSLTKNLIINQRWLVWLQWAFNVFIRDKDLSRTVYDKFEDGELHYREDCYDSYNYFEIPLLSEEDLSIIKGKMETLICEYEVEVREDKIKFEAKKLEEELILLKELSAKYKDTIL
jgi:hypothetical protein